MLSCAFLGAAHAQTQSLENPSPKACGDIVDSLNGQNSYYNGNGADVTCNKIYDPATDTWSEASGPDGLQYECVEFVRRYYRLAKGCEPGTVCNTAKWIGYPAGYAGAYFADASNFGLEAHVNGADGTVPQIEDVVAYTDLLAPPDGHVAVVKNIVPAITPDSWLVYVIEQNVAPTATALPLLLTKDPSTNFYTLTDSFPDGSGTNYGYPVGWKSRIGVQYSIQGWLRLPNTSTQTAVVVPAANNNVEGDIDNGYPYDIFPFGLTAQRYQQVYAAGEFGATSGLITQIRFRPDASAGSAFSATLPNVQIALSVTSASALTLSPTYADNFGSSQTTVYSGALALSSSFTGPSDGPKDFDVIVNLQTPFFYNPANGNLLMEVKNFVPVTTTPFDAVSSTAVVNRVFNLDNNPNATSGIVFNGIAGLVTQFLFGQ